jgi:hypothetical protein
MLIAGIILLANALLIWSDIMPSWWHAGFYELPRWWGIGSSLAAGVASIVYWYIHRR